MQNMTSGVLTWSTYAQHARQQDWYWETKGNKQLLSAVQTGREGGSTGVISPYPTVVMVVSDLVGPYPRVSTGWVRCYAYGQ
eukprot:3548329-Rhodomonas_salina.2